MLVGRPSSCWRWPAACSRCAWSRRRRPTRSSAAPAPATPRPSTCTSASATTRSTSSCASRSRASCSPRTSSEVLGLEGCLSGNVPGRAHAAGGADGPCARLAATQAGEGRLRARHVPQRGRRADLRPVQRPSQRAPRRRRPSARPTAAYELWPAPAPSPARGRAEYGEQAKQLVTAEFCRDVLALACATASPRRRASTTRSSSRAWCSTTPRGAGVRRRRASRRSSRAKSGALIQVRLRDGLTEAAAPAARSRTSAPRRRDAGVAALRQGDYAVTGAPVVVERALALDLALDAHPAARRRARVMALTLLLVFRARLRLLPLLVALCAAGADVRRACRSLGVPLTMASIAVHPGADRPRGRLRDPAPVAAAGGRRRGRHRGGGARAARARARRRS